MPPQLPKFSALRQGISSFKTLAAPLSTKAPSQALRKQTSSLLGMDSNSKHADPTALASDIFASMPGRKKAESRRLIEQNLQNMQLQDDHMRQITRKWNFGDVYSPHDLSPSEMTKWKKNTGRKQDLVDLLGVRPLDMYRNFTVVSEFITTAGRIKNRALTGLSPANQRKMAKAVRRSIGLGLHPSVHHHPELITKYERKARLQNMATPAPVVRPKWPM